MTSRSLLILALITMLFASADSLPRIPSGQLAAYSSGCKHYVNRARFLQRGTGAEFIVLLADSCEQAQVDLNHGSYGERRAALVYLSRLLDLRDTVIDMNMSRLFGDDYTPFTRLKHGVGSKTEAVPKVSSAGEYLIAHRMGLLDAYRAWLDTHPPVRLASNRGR